MANLLHSRLIATFCIIFAHLTASILSRESQLRIGKSINLIPRYGYLGISMRVIPYTNKYDKLKWIFKEPTRNIYKNISALIVNVEQNEKDVGSGGRGNGNGNDAGSFHGDFHMEFCDNRHQLFQAYFRNFTFEMLDKPHEAFTAGWFPEAAARKLGINVTYLGSDYAYVLLRISRQHERASLRRQRIPLEQQLESDVAEQVGRVQPGNVSSVNEFMETFGTHYVHSYTTGDSLFQIFAYSAESYQRVKESFKRRGVAAMTRLELFQYFSPYHADHIGEIRSASAVEFAELWSRRELNWIYNRTRTPSLLMLHGNVTLLRIVNTLLGNDALLQLDLRALDIVFRSAPAKQKWVQEVLDNTMKLWEVNLPLH